MRRSTTDARYLTGYCSSTLATRKVTSDTSGVNLGKTAIRRWPRCSKCVPTRIRERALPNLRMLNQKWFWRIFYQQYLLRLRGLHLRHPEPNRDYQNVKYDLSARVQLMFRRGQRRTDTAKAPFPDMGKSSRPTSSSWRSPANCFRYNPSLQKPSSPVTPLECSLPTPNPSYGSPDSLTTSDNGNLYAARSPSPLDCHLFLPGQSSAPGRTYRPELQRRRWALD